MQRALAGEVESGMTVAQWLLSHTAPEEPIFAVQGQAIHYLLQRPVVSVINPSYTTRKDDEPGFRKLMSNFRARYLVLFTSTKMNEAPEQARNRFLSQLASGEAVVPSWLTLSARSPELIIFECASCGKPAK